MNPDRGFVSSSIVTPIPLSFEDELLDRSEILRREFGEKSGGNLGTDFDGDWGRAISSEVCQPRRGDGF